MRRCECCGQHHECRLQFGDRCCAHKAADLLDEATQAAAYYPERMAVSLERIEYDRHEVESIPDPWRRHVPAFVVDSAGTGCDCCGLGSCWSECACGRRSPRYNCAQEARRWHINHVRRHLAGETTVIVA